MRNPRLRHLRLGGIAAATAMLAGCGRHYVILRPVGPVAVSELKVMTDAAVAMGIVIAVVLVLFAVTLLRFRDRPGRRAPYMPTWEGARWLEWLLFAIPLAIVMVVAVPTVRTTFALDRLPPTQHPLVVNVTSLDWKWLFEYPSTGIATVDRIEVPVGRPVLFKLTADSPMNTFWIPRLGGMEYAMPGRVLPLWLQVDKAGVYHGRSGNFSGRGFVHMVFTVRAVSPTAYRAWVAATRRTAPRLSMHGYRRLLRFNWVRPATYAGYPRRTFPAQSHGFTLSGGMYQEVFLPR